jgi:hypothetical protein
VGPRLTSSCSTSRVQLLQAGQRSPTTGTIYFGLGTDTPFGLRMTPECTLPPVPAASRLFAGGGYVAVRVDTLDHGGPDVYMRQSWSAVRCLWPGWGSSGQSFDENA